MGSRSRAHALRILVSSAALACLALPGDAAKIQSDRSRLTFEPNLGQAPGAIRYLLHDGEAAAGFDQDGFELLLPGAKGQSSRLAIRFAGARRSTITAEGPVEGKTNYLLGRNEAGWVRNVPHYATLEYGGVYPGIDVRFYGKGQELEHDFEVGPGGDPAQIALRIDGTQAWSVGPSGDLTLFVGNGQITLRKPAAYQTIEGLRREVEASFVRGKDGTVHFAVGKYDRSHRLVIDPVLVCATYLAALPSIPVAVATDAAGDTYIAGETEIFPFPTTPGSFMPSCAACSTESVYVTKLNATGTAEVFSTLLGGSQVSQPSSIAVDPNGDVVVGGLTYAADFPTKNSIVPAPSGSSGPVTGEFVTSLTPDGSALNDSTVVQGEGTISVAADTQGNVYFAGSAGPDENYPVTSGAVNTAGANEFATKMTVTGQLVWSAMLGTVQPSIQQQAIAVDSQGSLYITGVASSWPTTTGAYLTQQPQLPSVSPEYTGPLFVSKLSPDGTQLIYSTWIGWAAPEGLAVDTQGDAWIAVNGTAEYPVTSSAFNSYMPNGAYAYSELSPDGSQLLYSSFFVEGVPGGRSVISGIGVDGGNNVWLTGTTDDPGFPVMNPLDDLYTDGGFVTEFSPGGAKIAFSTYFPQAAAIALDPAGKGHIAGAARQAVYTTPGAFLNTAQWANNQDPSHSYVAVLDATVPAPSICIGAGGIENTTYLVDQSQPLQLTNCGNATLNVQSMTTTEPAFTVAGNNCAVVAAGDSCSVELAYAGSAGSSCNAVLTIASNASLPTLIPLTESASCPLNPGMGLEFAPTRLSFGSEATGTTSASQTITLTNPGYLPLTIVSITGTPEFPATNNCGTSIAPQASCTVSVAFAPLADGARTGNLTISSGASSNPLTISLGGTGTGPAAGVTMSPPILSFSLAGLGQTSAPQTVTLSNSGQGALSITSIAVSDVETQQGKQSQFAETDNCPALLAAGASCSINVTFSTAAGLFDSGTLAVTDNAANSPQPVTLLGNTSAFTMSATPASLTLSSAAGSMVTSTLNLTPYGGYTGSVALTCSVAWAGSGSVTPVYPVCLVPGGAVSMSSGAATAVLTIEAAPSIASNHESLPWRVTPVWAAALCLALGMRRRRWPLLLIALLLLSAGGISGCGGGGGSSGTGGGGGGGGGSTSTTTPGNYTVTVTASDGMNQTTTATVALTVQ